MIIALTIILEINISKINKHNNNHYLIIATCEILSCTSQAKKTMWPNALYTLIYKHTQKHMYTNIHKSIQADIHPNMQTYAHRSYCKIGVVQFTSHEETTQDYNHKK